MTSVFQARHFLVVLSHNTKHFLAILLCTAWCRPDIFWTISSLISFVSSCARTAASSQWGQKQGSQHIATPKQHAKKRLHEVVFHDSCFQDPTFLSGLTRISLSMAMFEGSIPILFLCIRSSQLLFPAMRSPLVISWLENSKFEDKEVYSQLTNQLIYLTFRHWFNKSIQSPFFCVESVQSPYFSC